MENAELPEQDERALADLAHPDDVGKLDTASARKV